MSDTTTNLRDGKTEVLIRAAKEGGSSAWSAVFQRYERMLRGHARTLVARHRVRIEPEDLVQTTFAHAWKNIQSLEYQGEGSFRRWLHRLARNLLLNQVREQAGQPELQQGTRVLDGAVDRRSVELERTRAERLSLDEALGLLDEEDRELLLMHSDERLSLNQIAAVLDCSHETASRRLAAAMRRLQQRLGGARG